MLIVYKLSNEQLLQYVVLKLNLEKIMVGVNGKGLLHRIELFIHLYEAKPSSKDKRYVKATIRWYIFNAPFFNLCATKKLKSDWTKCVYCLKEITQAALCELELEVRTKQVYMA